MGIPFRVFPSRFPESSTAVADPEKRTRQLALEKARHAASRIKRGLVVGADTVIVHKGKTIGKPRNRVEAKEILSDLSGDVHDVVTGVAVVEAETGRAVVEHVRTSVKMRRLTKEEIKHYVATGEPLGKAGAYAVQGIGAIFIERIEGCYYNVVGLPLPKLADMLKRFNVSVIL